MKNKSEHEHIDFQKVLRPRNDGLWGRECLRLKPTAWPIPHACAQPYHPGMSPNEGETAVPGCHCPGDIAVRMRKVPARPWVGVCVPLALSLSHYQ